MRRLMKLFNDAIQLTTNVFQLLCESGHRMNEEHSYILYVCTWRKKRTFSCIRASSGKFSYFSFNIKFHKYKRSSSYYHNMRYVMQDVSTCLYVCTTISQNRFSCTIFFLLYKAAHFSHSVYMM